MNNKSIIISTILLIMGFVFVLFHNKIIEIQGESKDFTYYERKYGMIIIGSVFIIIGFILLLLEIFN